MRATIVLLGALVVGTTYSPAAPPASISTAMVRPTARERIEQVLREGLPKGTPIGKAYDWLEYREAVYVSGYGSIHGGVICYRIAPCRLGLMISKGEISIRIVIDDAGWVSGVEVGMSEDR